MRAQLPNHLVLDVPDTARLVDSIKGIRQHTHVNNLYAGGGRIIYPKVHRNRYTQLGSGSDDGGPHIFSIERSHLKNKPHLLNSITDYGGSDHLWLSKPFIVPNSILRVVAEGSANPKPVYITEIIHETFLIQSLRDLDKPQTMLFWPPNANSLKSLNILSGTGYDILEEHNLVLNDFLNNYITNLNGVMVPKLWNTNDELTVIANVLIKIDKSKGVGEATDLECRFFDE